MFAEDILLCGNDPDEEARLIERMKGLLAPFVLRRLKVELADQMVTKSHVMHEVCASRVQHTRIVIYPCSVVVDCHTIAGIMPCVCARGSAQAAS